MPQPLNLNEHFETFDALQKRIASVGIDTAVSLAKCDKSRQAVINSITKEPKN